jgi:hypothetical protein
MSRTGKNSGGYVILWRMIVRLIEIETRKRWLKDKH